MQLGNKLFSEFFTLIKIFNNFTRIKIAHRISRKSRTETSPELNGEINHDATTIENKLGIKYSISGNQRINTTNVKDKICESPTKTVKPTSNNYCYIITFIISRLRYLTSVIKLLIIDRK